MSYFGKTAPALGGYTRVCRSVSRLPAITDPAESKRVPDRPAQPFQFLRVVGYNRGSF